MNAPIAYRVLALQTRCRSVVGAGREEARSMMKESIERIRTQIGASLGFIGPDCRLVVLPEYFLTGHPVGQPVAEWIECAALEPNGPEYQALGSIAKDHGIFLSGNAYEVDEHFDGLYFQASFVIDPSGATILRYRRLNSLMTPSPHDVWDRYVEIYGIDGVFPVTKTAIGNLACIASEEILFPELARAFAIRGAEVFLHSTSEASSPLVTQKDVARRARAIENLAYVVSANSAGIEGSPIPNESTDGGSQVVDFEGRVLVQAAAGESMVANTEIDITALRRARRRPGMANLLARNRFDAYLPVYQSATFTEGNALRDVRRPDRGWFAAEHRAVVERLIETGIIE